MTPALATEFDIAERPVAVPAETQAQEYWQHHPLQIAMCLRNLMSHHDRIAVAFDGGQFLVRILSVDSREGRFTFDAGNVDADNIALLDADALTFRSAPGTIHTQFTTGGAWKTRFDDRPAFEAAFPPALYYAQRREHFRVHTPSVEPYFAAGTTSAGAGFHLMMDDISLGGIAVKTDEAHFDDFALGDVLHTVEMHLGHFGTLTVDLEVMSPRRTTSANGEVAFVIGCRFVERTGMAERMLQRVIMHLETKRQSLALRA